MDGIKFTYHFISKGHSCPIIIQLHPFENFKKMDCYPFGMIQPGRSYNSNTYTYGFNGKEKDDEVTGVTGSHLDFGARIYDSRIGRWLACDPKAEKYPQIAPYAAFGLNPIFFIDPGGETLRVAGMTEKAMRDVESVLPQNYQAYLTKTTSGEIQWNNKKLNEDKIVLDMTDPGVQLIDNLINAKENYEYRVADKVNVSWVYTNNNEIKCTVEENLNNNGGNGLIVASNNAEGLTTSGRTNTIFAAPTQESGVDGQVTILPNSFLKSGKKSEGQTDSKPRASLVFHELWEVFNRTTKKMEQGDAHRDAQNQERELDTNDKRRDVNDEGEAH